MIWLALLLAAPVGDKVQDSGDAIRELKQEERELLDTLDGVIDERRAIDRRLRGVQKELEAVDRVITVEAERLAAEEKVVDRAMVDARARLRQLDRMVRGQALRFVIGAESFADGVRRSRVIERRFRRDAQLVSRATRIYEARRVKTDELERKRKEATVLAGSLDEVRRAAVANSATLQATLLAVRERRSLEERAYYDLRDFEATLQRESEEEAIASQDPFAQKKGRLSWPAARSALAPGPDLYSLHFTLAAGAEVRSLAAGTVEHAGELDGYRVVVIVKHSQNYYGVYAGLAQAAVKAGDSVGDNGRLGAAAASGVNVTLRRRTVIEEVSKWLAR